MDSKYVMLALGMDLLLIFVSVYFIYFGITSNQPILSVIATVLLLVGIVRLVIFGITFKKHGEE